MIEQQLATPMLRDGDVMDADEFLRRWEAMPDLKKAELIEGVVHIMASPVLSDHSRPDHGLQFWTGYYIAVTPGTDGFTNQSCQLGPGDTLQPDGSVGLPEDSGGQLRFDDRGLCLVAPELVAEVCASQTHADLLRRVTLFMRYRVQECVAVFPREARVEWYDRLFDGTPALRPPPEDGVYRSSVFPGLWLNARAALAGDRTGLLATVQAGCATPEHAVFVALLDARRTQGANP